MKYSYLLSSWRYERKDVIIMTPIRYFPNPQSEVHVCFSTENRREKIIYIEPFDAICNESPDSKKYYFYELL